MTSGMSEADFLKACQAAMKDKEFKDSKLLFCSSSHQPDIIWALVEKDRNFECCLCGAKAQNVCISKKIYACNNCMWQVK